MTFPPGLLLEPLQQGLDGLGDVFRPGLPDHSQPEDQQGHDSRDGDHRIDGHDPTSQSRRPRPALVRRHRWCNWLVDEHAGTAH